MAQSGRGGAHTEPIQPHRDEDEVAPEFGTGLRAHLAARGAPLDPGEPDPTPAERGEPAPEPKTLRAKWMRRKRRSRRPR